MNTDKNKLRDTNNEFKTFKAVKYI